MTPLVSQDEGNCLNCGKLLQGNFCSQCGQPATTGRITFKDTLNSFLSSVFSLEGPLLLTIYRLVINPGKVFREYIGGKRKTYYKPVPFFILLTAVYIILRALLHFDPLEGQILTPDQDTPEAIKKIREAARFMVDNINNIMFFLVFAIAFMLKLFFYKQYNLAEFTSVGLYIAGLYIIFGILMMFLQKFTAVHANNFQLLVLILLILYCTASLFKRTYFWSVVKYILVSIFSLACYMILGFGFSLIVVSLR